MFKLNAQLYIVSGLLIAFGLILIVSGFISKSNPQPRGITDIMNDLLHMPKTMADSCVQLFSWFAFYAMWIYTTPAVTQHIYGTTDSASELYNQGANWVGVLFGIYSGVFCCFCFSFARSCTSNWA